jgi:hypothetical protein
MLTKEANELLTRVRPGTPVEADPGRCLGPRDSASWLLREGRDSVSQSDHVGDREGRKWSDPMGTVRDPARNIPWITLPREGALGYNVRSAEVPAAFKQDYGKV